MDISGRQGRVKVIVMRKVRRKSVSTPSTALTGSGQTGGRKGALLACTRRRRSAQGGVEVCMIYERHAGRRLEGCWWGWEGGASSSSAALAAGAFVGSVRCAWRSRHTREPGSRAYPILHCSEQLCIVSLVQLASSMFLCYFGYCTGPDGASSHGAAPSPALDTAPRTFSPLRESFHPPRKERSP